MRSNVQQRSAAIEQHSAVERADLDYDDGEVVIHALVDQDGYDNLEPVLADVGLDVRSGPQYVGEGLEVVLA